MARKDLQHKGERLRFFDVPIYPNSHDMADPVWFKDMCEAAGRLARKHLGLKGAIGMSTGGTWSCMCWWEYMPPELRTELNAFYLQVVIEKAEERKRKAAEAAVETHHTPQITRGRAPPVDPLQ